MPPEFVTHLEELRRRLIVCLVAFLAAGIVAYFFSGELLEILIAPLRRFHSADLVFLKPYEAFVTHLKVAAITGFVASTPVFFTQGWRFVAPGLYHTEKKAMLPLIFVSVFLFIAGTLFAYWVVVPWGLHFLLSFQTQGLRPLLSVGPYFSFLTGMIVAFGLLFDFPVLILGLVRLGVVGSRDLAKARRLMIVCIFIAAAVLTPSPDPLSQLLLAFPLIFLFEVSLAIARGMESGRSRPPA